VLAALAAYALVAAVYRPELNNFQSSPSYESISGDSILGMFAKDNLSKDSEGLLGAQEEPINFIVFAKNDGELVSAFQKAGWYSADPVTFSSLFETARTAAFNEPYPTAPMTPAFWNGAVNDFNFEKPTATETVRNRHHSRFWKTNFKTQDDYLVYVGTASLDTGIKWGVTHAISPDLDTEREFMFNDLVSSGYVASSSKEKFTTPNLGKNFSGDQFFTDGKAYLIYLK
jgi:undecaprenyl-diphosphatase